MLKFVFSIVLLCSGSAFGSVSVHSRQDIAKHFRQAHFSGVVGVYTPANSFEEAFGFEGSRPIVLTDRFLIGSISKQFTAAAILKLSDQGQIDLNDSVAKYISIFPNSDVTVHHLLAQTSGISEVTNTPKFESLKKQKFSTLDPLVELIASLPMIFRPGDRWDYSNSNYLLLAKIVEVISGESWWDYVVKHLIDPARMKNTGFSSERGPFLVAGHELDRDYGLTEIDENAYHERGWANGAGGIESTPSDLALWNSALYSGRILSSKSLQLMTTAHGKVSDTFSYGYGLFIGTDPESGETFYFHGGGIPGFTAYNSFYPLRNMTVAVVSNYVSAEPTDFAQALARFEISGTANLDSYIDDPQVSHFPLDSYAGSFATSDAAIVIDLVFENGNLYGNLRGRPQHRLIIRGVGLFYDRSLSVELEFEQNTTDSFEVKVGSTRYSFSRRL